MPNQDSSLNPEASSGTSIGPVDELWNLFVKPYEHLSPDQLAQMKFVFFSASVMMYNLIVSAVRSDLSLITMSQVSEALRHNIEVYFATVQVASGARSN